MGKRKERREQLRAELKQLSHREIKAEVPREELDDATREKGSFAFGYCKKCDWQGSARRSRDKARRDALEHKMTCEGKHKVRMATTDEKK